MIHNILCIGRYGEAVGADFYVSPVGLWRVAKVHFGGRLQEATMDAGIGDVCGFQLVRVSGCSDPILWPDLLGEEGDVRLALKGTHEVSPWESMLPLLSPSQIRDRDDASPWADMTSEVVEEVSTPADVLNRVSQAEFLRWKSTVDLNGALSPYVAEHQYRRRALADLADAIIDAESSDEDTESDGN